MREDDGTQVCRFLFNLVFLDDIPVIESFPGYPETLLSLARVNHRVKPLLGWEDTITFELSQGENLGV